MRIALLLVLVACDAGQKAPTEPPPPERPAPPAVVPDATIADATIAASPDPWAPDDHADAPIPVDPDAIRVTWVIVPPSAPMDGEPASLQQRVSLEVTAGGVTRTQNLPGEFGGLQSFNQSACRGDAYPLEKGELAKITFYEGGAGGYFLKRTGDVLTIYQWSQTDGACPGANGELVACPRAVGQVGKLRVKAKAGAKIVEEILEIDDKGVRRPFDCGES